MVTFRAAAADAAATEPEPPSRSVADRSPTVPQPAAARHLAPARGPRDLAGLERLGDRIAELAAHLDAARYRLLVMIREFDAQEGWHGGFLSCAHWLSWRTSLAPGAAREHVRVARALATLPLTSAAMRTGELSYSKARALTRIATPENEAELVELSRHATAAQVERIVAGWRTLDRNEEALREEERHRGRELTIIQDGDGSYEIRGRVDAEVGAVLLQALKAAEEKLYPDRSARRDVPAHQRRADALGLVAEGALNGGTRAGSRADRFQVVVHVQAGELAEAPAEGLAEMPAERLAEMAADAADISSANEAPERRIERGPRVSAETCRRLACDCGRIVMKHDGSGGVLDVGRKTRTVPPAIRRALEHRDGGCRFPGCTNRICDAHHVVHWADGGETRLSNMISVCRRHHRLLHEGGYRAEMGPDGEARFSDPRGRVIPRVPHPSAIPCDAVAALRVGNEAAGGREAAGSGIGPWTATPLWHGERLDLDYAISVLWRPKREVRATDSA